MIHIFFIAKFGQLIQGPPLSKPTPQLRRLLIQPVANTLTLNNPPFLQFRDKRPATSFGLVGDVQLSMEDMQSTFPGEEYSNHVN